MEIEKSGTEKGRIFQAVEESLKLEGLLPRSQVQNFSTVFTNNTLHVVLFSFQKYLIERLLFKIVLSASYWVPFTS